MRLIVSGSRNTQHRSAMAQVKAGYASYLKLFPAATTLLQGGARGIDAAAKAFFSNLGIPVENYPADTARYGKLAYSISHQLMADVGDVLLAITSDTGRGSNVSLVREMRDRHKPVLLVDPETASVWGSYGVSPSAICRYYGWQVGDLLDRFGDVYKITKIEGDEVFGVRSNLGTDNFGSDLCWLPVDWSCTCITHLVGEG